MIGVIGGGSWATAIVKILLENNATHINWWVRSEETCKEIQRSGHNPRHLTKTALDSKRIQVSTHLADIVEKSDMLFLAVPSAYLHSVLSQIQPSLLHAKKIVSAIKGSVTEYCLSVSMYLEQILGVAKHNIGLISGPSHAEEVGCGLHTFLTIASTNDELSHEVEQALHCPYIHTSLSSDIDGIERCGLGKNIYAIAAGICQGLGYGDNLNAVLTLAAAREMRQLMDTFIPYPQRDFDVPCYFGDLMVTCWSPHSRNRRLGEMIARGKSLEEAAASIGTLPEGYYSVNTLHKRAESLRSEAPIPIVEAIYRILYEESDPRSEMDYLIEHVF